MVDKLNWLIEHGYVYVVDGVPWTTGEGTSLLYDAAELLRMLAQRQEAKR